MPFCLVAGCTSSDSHTTQAHRCSRCAGRGHGPVECDDALRRARLASCPEVLLPFPEWCGVRGCADPWSHIEAAHLCDACAAAGVATSCRCASSPAAYRGAVRCPTCRVWSPTATIWAERATCVVCLEATCTRMVLFEACKHANVCQACADRLG